MNKIHHSGPLSILIMMLILSVVTIPLNLMATQYEPGGMKIAAASTSSENFPQRDSEPLTSSSKPPLAPLDVTASEGQYADKIRVSWGSPILGYQVFIPLFFSSLSSHAPLPDSLYFQVYRSSTASIEDAAQLTDHHPVSPYDDLNALPGITYYYWVKACNSAGCSVFSSPASGWQAETISAPPTGVSASDGTFTDKVRITWNASSFATHYQVFRHAGDNFSNASTLTSYHPVSPYDDTTAEPGVTYYFWVKACNSAGCSGYSSPASGWQAETIPEPPSGLFATQGGSGAKVDLSWTASENARYYVVYRNTTNSHEDEKIVSEHSTTCTFEDEDVSLDILYYYWVKACNPAGCSDYSSPVSGWIGVITPTPPANVSASQGIIIDRIRVSWSASVSASYYRVFRSTTENLDHVEPLPGEPAHSPYEDVTAEQATIYFYWVKACNSAGCSVYSPSASGWITEPIPATPTGLSASKGTFIDKIHLSWMGSENAKYYQIFRNTVDDHTGQDEVEISHPNTTYNDLGATPGVIYYYWVKGCNSGGCSKYSESAQGWRAETLPVPPSGVNASDGHYTDKVLLSWSASEGAIYYEIYRHISDDHSGLIEPIHYLPESPYEDKTAVPGITYYYWVKACNSVGCSAFSNSDSGWRAVVNITNGDFEAGNDGSWTVHSTNGRPLIVHEDFTAIKPHSGQYLAWLGGDNDETSRISQAINIHTSHPYLHFWYQIHSQDMCQYDFAWIRINTVTWIPFNLCTPNNTVDWTLGVLDLSIFSGSTVTLEFEVTTDSSYVSSFYLDDITLSSIPSGGSNPRMNRIK